MIIGGGPGGYEAALVAAQLGAQVTVVDCDGLGGACVLTDCVPSKTLIATSGADGVAGRRGAAWGLTGQPGAGHAMVDAPRLYARVQALAQAQSADVAAAGGRGRRGHHRAAGALAGPGHGRGPATGRSLADVVLIATGAMPRVLPGAEPDGERHPDLAPALRPA